MSFKVLILEDDPDYQVLLKELYLDLLGTGDGNVTVCGDPVAALHSMRQGQYALLSLDINLSQAFRPQHDGTYPAGADGTRVLETAVKEQLIRGCIVFTGAPTDTLLTQVIPEGRRRRRIKVAMNAFLQEQLPGRHRLFFKEPADTIQEKTENLTPIREHFSSKRRLLAIAPMDLSVKLHFVGCGNTPAPRRKVIITEILAGSKHSGVELTDDRDVEYFVQLAELRLLERDEYHYLTDADIVAIFGGDDAKKRTQDAERDVAQDHAARVKRKVLKKGISPEAWALLLRTYQNKGRRLVVETNQVTGLGGFSDRRGLGRDVPIDGVTLNSQADARKLRARANRNSKGFAQPKARVAQTASGELGPAFNQPLQELGKELSKLWLLARQNGQDVETLAPLWGKDVNETRDALARIINVFSEFDVDPWAGAKTDE